MNRFARVKGSLSTMRRDGVDRDQFQEKDGRVRRAGEVGWRVGVGRTGSGWKDKETWFPGCDAGLSSWWMKACGETRGSWIRKVTRSFPAATKSLAECGAGSYEKKQLRLMMDKVCVCGGGAGKLGWRLQDFTLNDPYPPANLYPEVSRTPQSNVMN